MSFMLSAQDWKNSHRHFSRGTTLFMRFLAPLEILFYSGLWCIKFSFLAFLYRLSRKVKSFRIWWYLVTLVTIEVYITSVGDIQYKCSSKVLSTS